MRADQSFQSGLLFVACGFLAACSSGSSLTTLGGQDASLAYRSASNAQSVLDAAPPSGSGCQQLGQYRKLRSTGRTITFPPDCGVAGEIRIPDVKNLQTPPQAMALCENSQPIGRASRSRGCTVSLSDASCQQANSTFWYETITLLGEGAGATTHFHKGTFPVEFSSDTFIVPGNLYGLCVISTEGVRLIQDDFASGNAVAPVGDTVDLKIVLPDSYERSLYDGDALDVFFESKASSS